MDPTRPTARHHGPSLPLPSLRSLRRDQLERPHHPPAAQKGDRIDYAALRRRQAEARAAGIQAWRDRCDAVLRKPKAPGSVEPPLDAYVERTDGGAPYARATDEYRSWFGRTYVVDVDAITTPRGGAVLPDQGPGGGELAF
jgi:hypothetical protein